MKYFQIEDDINLYLEGQSKSVNLAKSGHIRITKELHRLMYRSDLRDRTLSVVYAQDTQPIHIPLGRLTTDESPPEHSSIFQDINIGAMSLRHHGIDFFCDFYLALNSEISSRDLTGRDTHLKAYSATKEKLSDLVSLNIPIWIQLVHTGLQPVICGIYHAIEEFIYSQRKNHTKPLVIEPLILYSKENNDRLTITPESKGAKIEDYTSLALWF